MTRVSVASDGTQTNLFSSSPAIAADGRYVAFASGATNLVAGDTNGVDDIFVRDGTSGGVEHISVSSNGTQANAASFSPAVSAGGNYVTFTSDATNLVAGDTNNNRDAFLRERSTGITERVSVASNGAQGNGGVTFFTKVSADGRYVVFESNAMNLVAGDTNNASDIFVRDRQSGTTERVSVASNGAQGNGFSAAPSISSDGRYVTFASFATNLVAGDTNGGTDAFLRDRQTGVTERVSVATGGAQSNSSSSSWFGHVAVSDNGQYLAFVSDATNLVGGDTNGFRDIFVRDRTAGTTGRVSIASDSSQANNHSNAPEISDDGSVVVFLSPATNLVGDDTNGQPEVFVRDRAENETQRMVAHDGAQANGGTLFGPSITDDGRYVAFETLASNLIPRDDTNLERDVYVHDRNKPGFDNMYPTANYSPTCGDGDLGDTYCQTDDADVTVFAEATVGDDGRMTIENVLETQYAPTNLDVEWHTEPVYDGDEETDIIYQREPGVPTELVAIAWCNDAIGGTNRCDQHYVRFEDGQPLPVSTTCHETGHTVGLTHGDDAAPAQDDDDPELHCMKNPSAGTATLGNHNIDQIKATYP